MFTMKHVSMKQFVRFVYSLAIIPILYILISTPSRLDWRIIVFAGVVGVSGLFITPLLLRAYKDASSRTDQLMNNVVRATQMISSLGLTSDQSEIVETLIKASSILLNTDMVTVFTMNPVTCHFDPSSSSQVTEQMEKSIDRLYMARLTDRNNPHAWIANDLVAKHCDEEISCKIMTEHGIKLVAGCPIRFEHSIIGAIVCYFESTIYEEEALKNSVEILAAQASTALASSSFKEESDSRVDELFDDNMELRLQVKVDGLTGLLNHRTFQQDLAEQCSKAMAKAGRQFCLIMADVDHFKKYNDTYGHRQGDIVLQEVGSSINSLLRSSDTAARYGGEEFAIILPRTDKRAAYLVAEKIRLAIAALNLPEGNATISVGVAEFPLDATTPGELVECADKALYRAKELGRNQVFTWKSDTQCVGDETDFIERKDAA